MLGWDQYGFDKKRFRTRCAKLVFLHLMESAGHVVHSVRSRHETSTRYFSCLDGTGTYSTKAHWNTLHRTCVFASSGICGSRSALRGTKCRHTIFQARVGLNVGCGPIFSMNTTMGMKITREMLTNSPVVPLLPMQQILTLWIFATPHTCARSHQQRSNLQSINS
jgi:hypothetical protein